MLFFSSSLLAADFSVRALQGGERPVAQSDAALAILDVDIENNPGWVGRVKAGYQWKLFRNAGFSAYRGRDSAAKSRSFTKSGFAASAGFGYNFGPNLPLTLGLLVSAGPGGNFTIRGLLGSFQVEMRQKIRIYTLDASLDYEFRTPTRWTPFAGIATGLAFVSDKGRIAVGGPGGRHLEESYGTKHRVNLVGGFRAGAKWRMNDRVSWAVYGTYTYLGSIPSRRFSLSDGTQARSNRTKAHALDAKSA